LYQLQQQELIMEETHHPATESLAYQPSDWSVNSNKSSALHREDVYPPLPSYPSYDNNTYANGFHHTLPQPAPPPSQDMYQFSWPNTVTTPSSHLDHGSSSPIEDKFNHQQASPDFLLRKKAPYASSPSLPSNYMSFSSLPTYHYSHNARPNNTAVTVRADKFHPRFKSANARLSPYSEQQQRDVVYNHFMSPPPLVSNALMGQGPLMLEEGLERKSVELQPFHQNKESISNQT
jgi:hypothetical protein